MDTQVYTDEQRLADINIAIRNINELLASHEEEDAMRLAIDIHHRCDRIGVVVGANETLGRLLQRLYHRRKVEQRVFGKPHQGALVSLQPVGVAGEKDW